MERSENSSMYIFIYIFCIFFIHIYLFTRLKKKKSLSIIWKTLNEKVLYIESMGRFNHSQLNRVSRWGTPCPVVSATTVKLKTETVNDHCIWNPFTDLKRLGTKRRWITSWDTESVRTSFLIPYVFLNVFVHAIDWVLVISPLTSIILHWSENNVDLSGNIKKW